MCEIERERTSVVYTSVVMGQISRRAVCLGIESFDSSLDVRVW